MESKSSHVVNGWTPVTSCEDSGACPSWRTGSWEHDTPVSQESFVFGPPPPLSLNLYFIWLVLVWVFNNQSAIVSIRLSLILWFILKEKKKIMKHKKVVATLWICTQMVRNMWPGNFPGSWPLKWGNVEDCTFSMWSLMPTESWLNGIAT